MAIARFLVAGLLLGAALPLASCAHEYKAYHSADIARTWDLGGGKVAIEIAKDMRSRQLGLMHRKSMPHDHGMLFVYPEPQVLRFWMKDCAIPLSIAFLEEAGDHQLRVVNIDDMQPFVEIPGGVSLKPVRLALEMNQGWFAEHGVKPGDVVAAPTWIDEIVASEDS
jgi:uncharacterized membrane protein (UPF0127 family)